MWKHFREAWESDREEAICLILLAVAILGGIVSGALS